MCLPPIAWPTPRSRPDPNTGFSPGDERMQTCQSFAAYHSAACTDIRAHSPASESLALPQHREHGTQGRGFNARPDLQALATAEPQLQPNAVLLARFLGLVCSTHGACSGSEFSPGDETKAVDCHHRTSVLPGRAQLKAYDEFVKPLNGRVGRY